MGKKWTRKARDERYSSCHRVTIESGTTIAAAGQGLGHFLRVIIL
jgi:hypothetical protein